MRALTFCLLLALLPVPSFAAVDLVTVPERRAVELTIYNSADLTLVRDRRLLTFQEGMNVLQFTWAGTLIDASSIELHFRSKQSQLTLLDTVFPPGRSDALQWTVESTMSGDAEVEITYFTSGITWSSAYKGHVTQADRMLDLRGAIAVTNHSGEDYPHASIRLIVGTVNLVENIAELARNRGGWGQVGRKHRNEAYREFRMATKKAQVALESADSEGVAPKGIVKEGLSEYFVFRIEGTETIPNTWSKSLNALDVKNVPVQVTFRLSDNWGEQVFRFLRFDNRSVNDRSDKTNLGQAPLPGGAIHLFRRNDTSNLSYLTQQTLPYVPIHDKSELNTGPQSEVAVSRVTENYRRENVVFERNRLKSYDEVFTYRTTIRNALPFPVAVEIERVFPGSAELSGLEFNVEKVNHQTVKFYPTIEAGGEQVFTYTVVVRHKYF